MSLSGALTNAVSGLSINARSANLISSNISNALTDGYGRREAARSASTISSYGGVLLDGIIRHSDSVLLHDRRQADAAAAAETELSLQSGRIEALVGAPQDGDSLVSRLARFEATIISASADPASIQRLDAVAIAAQDVTQKFTDISAGLQQTRENADREIASVVARLNDGLNNIADMNVKISRIIHTGRDTSALQDQRQREIDAVSELVPLRVIERDRETVALVSMKGAILLDGKPPTLGFVQSNVVAPHMTQENGLLSGLTLNDRPLDVSSKGPMSGGHLGALFDVRDRVVPENQSILDALALDLAERFGPGGADASIAPGQPGMFTDEGAFAEPLNLVGLAGRLTLAPSVAPGAATLWKLRDGLNTVSPGPSGDATLLTGMLGALHKSQSATAPVLSSLDTSFLNRIAEFTSQVASDRVNLSREASFSSERLTGLREQERAKGVDTDQELQHLMRVEQAYAANAQVMQVVDDLMKLLLNR